MKNRKPTPLELSMLAAIIAVRYPNKRSLPLEDWFCVADELLEKAAEYLDRPAREAEAHQRWCEEHPVRAYPFEEVLREKIPPESGSKKGRTMLGKITTQKGLTKAIRRVFGKKEADEIVRCKSLFGIQIDAITRDQNKRVRQRILSGQ